ncbi:sugar transferase [Flavobacterium columnare]|uniref:Undecaprenyl-phosphate galactose phosphotransferase n=1 Tax=Flavobacterium columnare (strain ATCC 49512 / CIP 103533 / TG 44/87) TaxID=1041826 RepID=G8X9V3_FLACA|nr:sugar transferase [Flavobacterium columnare]AEW87301.1 undecaprenyl-phosphate galactose phosphotransferase [Flavobacterium columnare ATCC 49512]
MNRVVDLLLLLIFLPLLGTVFFLVALFAFLFHGKTIFFKQMRVGKDKKPFQLYKFRSMVHGAQNMGTGLYSYEDDFRITPFGKFIRTTSLDEFPQLLNVLKGDMSFVGPRPAVVGELDQESDLPSNTDERFKMRPGLTGWAQIHGRDNLTWREKIQFDLEFVNASLLRKAYMCVYVLCFTPLYVLNFSVTYEKKK